MEYDKYPIVEEIGNYIQWMLPLAALICTLLGSWTKLCGIMVYQYNSYNFAYRGFETIG